MRSLAALLCLLSALACTPLSPPVEPIIEAPIIVDPVIVEESVDPCATGDGDGIGGTGCPVD